MNIFKKLLAVALISFVSFCIGDDWPYIIAPKDFGDYSFDGKYKAVVLCDETRICMQVSILDNENYVKYNTSGYMNRGWHHGKFDVEVSWSPCSYDLFVGDSRGTLDVYRFVEGFWYGPYSIEMSGESEYLLMTPPYEYDLASGIYDNVPIAYPRSYIPFHIQNELLQIYSN